MCVVGYDVFGIGCYGTIYKLVIVGVGLNQSEVGRACSKQFVSRTMRLIGIGGAHMLCTPLFNRLLANAPLVPQRVNALLGLLCKVMGQKVLELVQLFIFHSSLKLVVPDAVAFHSGRSVAGFYRLVDSCIA